MSGRNTPEPIKRFLRKEAGYGCCICGDAIIEYHHIIPWEEENHYRPEDMMVLCPNHHTEVGNSRMPQAKQLEYKHQPYNLKKGYANGKLSFYHEELAVQVGNNTFIESPTILTVGGERLLWFEKEENYITFNAILYDRHDNLLVKIVNNEWQSNDHTLFWDIEAKYPYLKIKQESKLISFEFDARTLPIKLKGSFWRGGIRTRFTPTAIIRKDLHSEGRLEKNVCYKIGGSVLSF